MQPLPDSLTIETTTELHNVTKRDSQKPFLNGNEDNPTTINDEESSPDLNEFDLEDTADFTTTEIPTEPAVKMERVQLQVDRVEQNNETDKLKILLKHDLVNGRNYTIDIKFSGFILNNLIGLYKTHYVDTNNNVK